MTKYMIALTALLLANTALGSSDQSNDTHTSNGENSQLNKTTFCYYKGLKYSKGAEMLQNHKIKRCELNGEGKLTWIEIEQ